MGRNISKANSKELKYILRLCREKWNVMKEMKQNLKEKKYPAEKRSETWMVMATLTWWLGLFTSWRHAYVTRSLPTWITFLWRHFLPSLPILDVTLARPPTCDINLHSEGLTRLRSSSSGNLKQEGRKDLSTGRLGWSVSSLGPVLRPAGRVGTSVHG